MSTLLGHLAHFGLFYTQGELLCTQGLAFLLGKHASARMALVVEIETRTGVRVSHDLTWHAEVVQPDGGRPDLEGRTADLAAIVKIEGKLGADMGPDQFRSYVLHLQQSVTENTRVLLVLVPRGRTDEAKNVVTEAFGPSGHDHWQSSECPAVRITVVSWEHLLTKLREHESDPLPRYEIEQLEAMYRVLSGNDILPLAGLDQLREWRKRETDFINLVDQTTRRLIKKHASHSVYPMLVVPSDQPPPEGLEDKGYRCRYLWPTPGSNSDSGFRIGVRDPFDGSDTPIWLRFHREIPLFTVIRDRLERSHLATRLVPSGGHIWLPLSVPLNADAKQMVDELVAQAEEVIQVVYQRKP